MSIWQAQIESKCKFFVWVVMQDRVLTTNNMIERNWPCDYYCALCLCLHEITEHLLTQYNFAEAAWDLIANHFGLPCYSLLAAVGGPKQWVTYSFHP
jgi:hypothetical protein